MAGAEVEHRSLELQMRPKVFAWHQAERSKELTHFVAKL
jgi:hypothetical protein